MALSAEELEQVLSPIRFVDGALELLDQRKLPTEELWVRCSTVDEVAHAIRDMIVRGAPAIGVTAAYGVALAARTGVPLTGAIQLLGATRPTAVNLFWALDRMRRVIDGAAEQGDALADRLTVEAEAIHEEDVAFCLAIGRHGAALLPEGTVLTHCNAGALATGGYGTALGVIRAAVASGKQLRVYADETRPFLQGARLTAWELMKSGIDVTLITDNMAPALMRRGEIQSVVVGADRIARNGDVANKIGTYGVALAARAHGLPFLVAAPRSTLDLTMATGASIPIEERTPLEVTALGGRQVAPSGVRVRNPAFDVTPAELVSAIVTEQGVARAPFEPALSAFGAATR